MNIQITPEHNNDWNTRHIQQKNNYITNTHLRARASKMRPAATAQAPARRGAQGWGGPARARPSWRVGGGEGLGRAFPTSGEARRRGWEEQHRRVPIGGLGRRGAGLLPHLRRVKVRRRGLLPYLRRGTRPGAGGLGGAAEPAARGKPPAAARKDCGRAPKRVPRPAREPSRLLLLLFCLEITRFLGLKLDGRYGKVRHVVP